MQTIPCRAAACPHRSRCLNRCVSHHQITIKGHEIGEDKIASAALLDHGPAREPPASSEAVVFKVQHSDERSTLEMKGRVWLWRPRDVQLVERLSMIFRGDKVTPSPGHVPLKQLGVCIMALPGSETLRRSYSLPLHDCKAFLPPERASEQGGEESEGDETMRGGDTNRAQLALLEVWMGLPGYGTTKGRAAEGDAAAALTKLKKALIVDEHPVASSSKGESPEEGEEAITPTSTLQVWRSRQQSRVLPVFGRECERECVLLELVCPS